MSQTRCFGAFRNLHSARLAQRMMILCALAAAASMALGEAARAEIIHVPGDYPNIRAAAWMALDGDEIVVAPGEYIENVNLYGKAITLRSTDPDDPDIVASTIINGGGLGPALTCISGEGPDTLITGLTITNGDAEGIGLRSGGTALLVRNCTFTANSIGIDNTGGRPTVYRCLFTENNIGLDNGWGDITVTECTFIENSRGMHNERPCTPIIVDCDFSNNSTSSYGGGMWNADRCQPIVWNCTFIGNSAYRGGAIWNQLDCDAIVSDCTFIDNHATKHGGAMLNYSSDVTVVDCTFDANTAETGGAVSSDYDETVVLRCTFTQNDANLGGGMADYGGTPLLVDCAFTENSSLYVGGAMYAVNDEITVVDCLLIGNAAGNAGGALFGNNCDADVANSVFSNNAGGNGRALACDSSGHAYPSDVAMHNCILRDGGDEIWNNDESAIAIAYSCIDGGYEGAGNIDADPLFVDPENGDLRLSPGSPCIDAGANNALPADSLDLDEDGDTAERIPLDFDGSPRFADDPATPDSGCGAPVIVDMGAFEFEGDPWQPMRIGDIDGDGDVDTADLLALLGAWGGYEDACVLADLDFSGEIDTADLLTLLANWG